jgi:hypothetical protein
VFCDTSGKIHRLVRLSAPAPTPRAPVTSGSRLPPSAPPPPAGALPPTPAPPVPPAATVRLSGRARGSARSNMVKNSWDGAPASCKTIRGSRLHTSELSCSTHCTKASESVRSEPGACGPPGARGGRETSSPPASAAHGLTSRAGAQAWRCGCGSARGTWRLTLAPIAASTRELRAANSCFCSCACRRIISTRYAQPPATTTGGPRARSTHTSARARSSARVAPCTPSFAHSRAAPTLPWGHRPRLRVAPMSVAQSRQPEVSNAFGGAVAG